MAGKKEAHVQTLFVIRHGERLDHVDYNWVERSERPYDPPLTKSGEKQASQAGEMFKGRDIECIISSPFLRCLQTAQQVCNSLQLPGITICNRIVDILNSHCGIHEQPIVPTDNVADMGINVLINHHEAIPTFPENTIVGLKRYNTEINRLADEHWPKNIVIVTHLYGVCQAVAMTKGEEYFILSDVRVDYCGYVEMSRTSKEQYDWREQATARSRL